VMTLHPEILIKDGKKQFTVLPYEEFMSLKEYDGRRSEKVFEVFEGNVGGVQNLFEGTRFDHMMAWDNHEMFVVGHRNMLDLAKDIEAGAFEGSHDAFMRDLRQFGHTLTSTVLSFFKRLRSSMLSRYVLMASLMLSNASSSVSPCETHPFKVGQYTTYPPASESCSRTIGYSMCTSQV
jgi:hypothetical protein